MSLKELVIMAVIFSIVLNISLIAITKIPAFSDYSGSLGGATYSDTYNQGWEDATEGINNTIPLAGDEVSNSGAFNSVMDFLGLKTFVKFFGIIDYYMFGFINVLSNILRGPLNSAGTGLGDWIFGGLKGIMSLGYVFLMFYLFTGRSIEGK